LCEFVISQRKPERELEKDVLEEGESRLPTNVHILGLPDTEQERRGEGGEFGIPSGRQVT